MNKYIAISHHDYEIREIISELSENETKDFDRLEKEAEFNLEENEEIYTIENAKKFAKGVLKNIENLENKKNMNCEQDGDFVKIVNIGEKEFTLIVTKEWFSVERCQENPNKLFIFGDNTIRVGKGGQAQIRDCPNSLGIATKAYPSSRDFDYFNDANLSQNFEIMKNDIDNIIGAASLCGYNEIVFPYDGFGTGLSELPTRAPQTFKCLEQLLISKFGLTPNEFKTVEK